jgi:hypothetical protein
VWFCTSAFDIGVGMMRYLIFVAAILFFQTSTAGLLDDFMEARRTPCESIINYPSKDNKKYSEACLAWKGLLRANDHQCMQACYEIEKEIEAEKSRREIKLNEEYEKSYLARLEKHRLSFQEIIRNRLLDTAANYRDRLNHACFDGTHDIKYAFDEKELHQEDCKSMALEEDQKIRVDEERRIALAKEELARKQDEQIALVRSTFSNGKRFKAEECGVNSGELKSNDDFEKVCKNEVELLTSEGLKSKTLKPKNCTEWAKSIGLDGRYETIMFGPMTVSIRSKGVFGYFGGNVRSISESELTIHNKQNNNNAYVIVEKNSVIFNEKLIAVGMNVSGYGTQSATSQVRLAGGEATTVAVVKAKCINAELGIENMMKILGM